MTKTRPFLSMCYGDPSATEVPPCCEIATKKLTFSTTSVLLLLNMPLSLSRATIFRRQKNPRRVYRPKIAGILFVCNEPEGKYYTVPCWRDKNFGWDGKWLSALSDLPDKPLMVLAIFVRSLIHISIWFRTQLCKPYPCISALL